MTWPTKERKDKTLRERVHDRYLARTKPRGNVICPECGAVFAKGRWSWDERPDGARDLTCPACRRLREEILNLVRRIADSERLGHPLNRVMQVEQLADGVLITTADLHLRRRLDEADALAYSGSLSLHYDIDDDVIRVEWGR